VKFERRRARPLLVLAVRVEAGKCRLRRRRSPVICMAMQGNGRCCRGTDGPGGGAMCGPSKSARLVLAKHDQYSRLWRLDRARCSSRRARCTRDFGRHKATAKLTAKPSRRHVARTSPRSDLMRPRRASPARSIRDGRHSRRRRVRPTLFVANSTAWLGGGGGAVNASR